MLHLHGAVSSRAAVRMRHGLSCTGRPATLMFINLTLHVHRVRQAKLFNPAFSPAVQAALQEALQEATDLSDLAADALTEEAMLPVAPVDFCIQFHQLLMEWG